MIPQTACGKVKTICVYYLKFSGLAATSKVKPTKGTIIMHQWKYFNMEVHYLKFPI